jgi:oxygen-dependent protoporphyrinogen oxidase
VVGELFQRPRVSENDESVASLVERHYGAEMVDRLADPLLSGIYGGEATTLSVRAVLPRFAEMERTHGSLGRAMLSARKKMSSVPSQPAATIFSSLKNGMQQLVEAVVSRLSPLSLLTDTTVQAVRPEAGGWILSAGQRSEHFDGVILAVPTYAAAEMLRPGNGGISSELAAGPATQLATELTAVQYSSSITVGLGYDREARQLLPPGFGFLVPRSEEKHMLAATFVHNKFPHRAAPDRALLRCFIGGVRAEAAWPLTDDQIVCLVRSELQQILGVRSEPLLARVYRWKAAMAQYGVGHLERLERIERLRQQLPGLGLAGNGYRGIGVPDCIRSGREAAAEVIAMSP